MSILARAFLPQSPMHLNLLTSRLVAASEFRSFRARLEFQSIFTRSSRLSRVIFPTRFEIEKEKSRRRNWDCGWESTEDGAKIHGERIENIRS